MTGTVAALIAAARHEVGVHEDPPGSNRQPYAAEVGHANGYAWCQTFCNAMAKRAGIELATGVMQTAYTPAAVNAWKNAGRWSPTPEAGDFVYFQFDSDPQVDHVGIVIEVLANGDVRTIEGNTSPSNVGSQSHGGQVCERVRPRRLIAGFGRPHFTAAPTPAQETDDMTPAQEKLLRDVDAKLDKLLNSVAGYSTTTAGERDRDKRSTIGRIEDLLAPKP